MCETHLIHPPDESVDLVLAVASVSSLHEMRRLLVHAAAWRRQLEGPQEVVGGFEVLADGVDLVDQILHTDDPRSTCEPHVDSELRSWTAGFIQSTSTTRGFNSYSTLK